MPNEAEIDHIEEPIILATIHLPKDELGNILKLCEEKRGLQKELRFLGINRVMLTYELPLNEIVFDFYDRLKSLSHGYASMDYEMVGMRKSDLAKLDVRINGDVVDAMSMIIHKDNAYTRGRDLAQKMRSAAVLLFLVVEFSTSYLDYTRIRLSLSTLLRGTAIEAIPVCGRLNEACNSIKFSMLRGKLLVESPLGPLISCVSFLLFVSPAISVCG